jgi:putative plasmid partition protein
MKIISFNIKAGGVGKSTLCFNTAFLLAEKGYRVLTLGTDTNMNITKRFVGYYARKHGLSQEQLLSEIKPENTVEMLFKGLPFAPIKITDNIDLIAETTTLYSLQKIVEASLIYWYWDNEKYLKENYDYILIDTHNDDEIATRATYAVSDVIAVVVDETNKTYDIIPVMRQNLTEIKKGNRDRNGSLVNAKIVLLGNRLDTQSVLGKRMRNELNKLRREEPDTCAGYIEERVSVKKAEELYLPLTEFKKKERLDASLERFYRETERTLLRLVDM